MKYPDGIKAGTLLRVVKHCRKNTSILESGEYAIIAPKESDRGTFLQWDALFPDGRRIIFVAKNWEVISGPE